MEEKKNHAAFMHFGLAELTHKAYKQSENCPVHNPPIWPMPYRACCGFEPSAKNVPAAN